MQGNKCITNNTKSNSEKVEKNFVNAKCGMNSSSIDSLISRSSNNSNKVVKASSDLLVDDKDIGEHFHDSNSDDNHESDSVLRDSRAVFYTSESPLKIEGHPGQHKSNYFLYTEKLGHKNSAHLDRKELNHINNTVVVNSGSTSCEQQFLNRQSTYSKTAGVNSSISATANNHRKNLKLRHQNMDHDYR